MTTVSLLVAALVGQAIEECPTLLVRTSVGKPSFAQPYADCMSLPSLPAAGKLPEKQQQCAGVRGPSAEVSANWVDQIATNFPGCETRIEFKRK